MSPIDHKATLYLDRELIAEVKAEAARHNQSMSWVVRRCIEIALPRVVANAAGEPFHVQRDVTS